MGIKRDAISVSSVTSYVYRLQKYGRQTSSNTLTISVRWIKVQYTFGGSNTDGSFFLSPLEKSHSGRLRIIKGDFYFLY